MEDFTECTAKISVIDSSTLVRDDLAPLEEQLVIYSSGHITTVDFIKDERVQERIFLSSIRSINVRENQLILGERTLLVQADVVDALVRILKGEASQIN